MCVEFRYKNLKCFTLGVGIRCEKCSKKQANFVGSLYDRVNPEAREMAKKVGKVGALAGTLYAGANIAQHLLEKMSAYGSHMVGKGECTRFGYEGAKGLYGLINDLNNDETRLFGNQTSYEVGNWLLTKVNGTLGKINEAKDYLMNKCGESQQFLDSLATYKKSIVGSLALHGTDPTKVSFFGSAGTDAIVLITGAAIASTIALLALARKRYGNIFHNPEK